MNAKEKLTNILMENKKLKEELKMKLKENEAKVDAQSPATPTQATPAAGSKLEPKTATQDDLSQKYAENEAKTDVQTTPGQPVSKSDGTTAVADTASQDDLAKKYPASKMETATEEPAKDEVKKESDDADEDDKQMERFKEFEGDMGKLVEIMEALKGKVDNLEKEVASMKNAGAKPVEQGEEKGQEPLPPMTEKASLGNVFVENMKTNKNDFGKIVQKVIY